MRFIQNFSSIGQHQSDSDNVKIQKSFLVFLSAIMSLGGLLWGLFACANGLYFQAIIPLSYVVISFLNVALFKYSKNFETVRFIQVFISLVLPFLFQWSMGGFFSSGGMMLWAVLSLLASLLFEDFYKSAFWFVFFFFATAISVVFDGYFYSIKPEVLNDTSLLFLSINIGVISTLVFGFFMFFVSLNNETKDAMEVSRLKIQELNKMLSENYNEIEMSQTKLKLAHDEVKMVREQLSRVTRQQFEVSQKLLISMGIIEHKS